jgi:hypothetical protein
MDTYRIMKWWPDRPETKEPATDRVFTNLELAEGIKAAMEKYVPQRCFAVDTVKEGD